MKALRVYGRLLVWFLILQMVGITSIVPPSRVLCMEPGGSLSLELQGGGASCRSLDREVEVSGETSPGSCCGECTDFGAMHAHICASEEDHGAFFESCHVEAAPPERGSLESGPRLSASAKSTLIPGIRAALATIQLLC